MRSLNLTEIPISSLTSHIPACQINFGPGMPAIDSATKRETQASKGGDQLSGCLTPHILFSA